jgi:hypothetical protein
VLVLVAQSNRRIFEEGPTHAQAEETPLHGQDEATPVHAQDEATPVHVQAKATPVHVQAEATPVHVQAEAHDPFYGFDIQEVASQPAAANSREKLPVMRGSGSAGGKFTEYFTASGNY